MSTEADFQALKAAGFVGRAERIDDIDIPRIGYIIGVGEDVLHALIDVESSGSGFDKRGRPKMLYEPHVFFRNSSGQARALAVAKGIAYKEWKRGNYPLDSYPRLMQALELDEDAALKGASWGLTQILGENYVAAGYDSPQDMVVAFCSDEAEHLKAMVLFIKAKGIDDELRRIQALGRPSTPDDWRPVARAYNGSKYEANDYHGKLASRHNWWRGKKDTPWTPDMPTDPVPGPVVTVPELPGTIMLPDRSGPVYEAYLRLMEYFGDSISLEGE